MAHEMIIAEQHGRVGVIKFNRPERLRAPRRGHAGSPTRRPTFSSADRGGALAAAGTHL